ncbi:Hemerythrin HHE cation binding domain protein [compost metagenome]
MKRNENIAALSRDHHFGLLFCWKIREALKRGVATDRILPYLDYFMDNHLRAHFEIEEKLLLNGCSHPLCQQAQAEHRQIRDDFKKAASGNSALLLSLADRLERHIRFEERTLFPQLEILLTKTALKEIGCRLNEFEQQQQKDEYPDEFWKKSP